MGVVVVEWRVLNADASHTQRFGEFRCGYDARALGDGDFLLRGLHHDRNSPRARCGGEQSELIYLIHQFGRLDVGGWIGLVVEGGE